MAESLCQTRRPATVQPGKSVSPVALVCKYPELHFFVSERSRQVFEKMGTNGNWLYQDVNMWENDKEFCKICTVLPDVKVVR